LIPQRLSIERTLSASLLPSIIFDPFGAHLGLSSVEASPLFKVGKEVPPRVNPEQPAFRPGVEGLICFHG